MIDDCMGKRASRLVAELLALHKPIPIEAHFLADYLGKSDVWDVDWSQRLADEGEWCVVSCDFRRPKGEKAKSKGPPLHLILPAKKITGFFFAGKIANLSGFDKARSIIYVIPELIEKANSAMAGSRFKVHIAGSGFALVPWPLRSGPALAF